MKRAALVLVALVGTGGVLVAAAGCDDDKKKKGRVVDAGPVQEKEPEDSLPPLSEDVLPPSRNVEAPPGGTCIVRSAAEGVSILASGKVRGCPVQLDRTMSGDPTWPKVFQTLGLVVLNEPGTKKAHDEGKADVCCYDVRKPPPK